MAPAGEPPGQSPFLSEIQPTWLVWSGPAVQTTTAEAQQLPFDIQHSSVVFLLASGCVGGQNSELYSWEISGFSSKCGLENI